MVERGRTWTDDEIEALLEIWGDSVIQRQLKDSTRNVVVFRSIAAALEAKGYTRTYQQCREKLKALKKKYKEQTDRLRASGVGVDSDDDLDDVDIYFKWYVEIHKVIGGRAAVNPPALLESCEIGSSSQHTPTPVSVPVLTPVLTPVHTPNISSPTPPTTSTTAPTPVTATVPTPEMSSPVPAPVPTPVPTPDMPSPVTTPVPTPDMTSVPTPPTPPPPPSPIPSPPPSSAPTLTTPSLAPLPAPSSAPTLTTPSSASTHATTSTGRARPGPSGEQPATKRKRPTKMDRVERSTQAMFNQFLISQEETKRELIKLEEQRMRMEEEQRKRDDERDKLFLSFMKDAFTSICSTTALPYAGSVPQNFQRLPQYVPPQPYGNPPPAASTQAPVPPTMDDFHTFPAADPDYPPYTARQDEV